MYIKKRKAFLTLKMKLKAKFLNWDAGIPVVMLNKTSAEKLGVRAQDTIILKTLSGQHKESTAVLDIIGGEINDKEILISSEVKLKLNIKKETLVDVNLAPVPRSFEYIKEKLNGKRLSTKEIDQIIQDVVNDRLSDSEIAVFVAAMYKVGMDTKENVDLIKAIIKNGNRLSLKEKYIVDKHSIGGVAGNRTTPIVVSICASAGLFVPKTSSRAITSAAGTADVMETIARVDFTIPELKKIIRKTKAFIIWGGGIGVVPADSKIIRVEKSLNIDPKSQLLASILSKKFAVGSKYIVIDIPYGRSAKVKSRKSAEDLKRKFQQLGNYFNKKMRIVLTDGSQPIGNGIGPSLELKDIISILDPRKKGPEDLRKKSVFLAGELLEMTKKAKKGKGIEMAEDILDSGKAFKKFKEIVEAQGGNLKRVKYGKFKKTINSKKSGKIKEIDNKKINALTRVTGSPIDKSAGIYLHVHVGDKIKKSDPVVTLYSETDLRLKEAIKFYNDRKPIKIS